MSEEANYDLKNDSTLPEMPVTSLDISPPSPKQYQPRIGLIACGGITESHLKAYKAQGWPVLAFADVNREAAEKRRDEFNPQADVYCDYHDLLQRDDIDVVDIALHPSVRGAAIEAALLAGKHVLSQKPFTLDLDEGARLAQLAADKGLKLAVNQNGRWAPYVRWMTRAVQEGLIGEVQSVCIEMNWDHTWVKGTAFEEVHHVILYDFAIHWMDMLRCFMGDRKAVTAFAHISNAPGQEIKPPMMACAQFGFENAVATLMFDGHSRHAPREQIRIVGTKGVLHAEGNVCNAHQLRLETAEGCCEPTLTGEWFAEGFQGTMGELLCAIEADRIPENNAFDNLKSLELAFAAIHSADCGVSVVPGQARRITTP
jgi:predicted dehydrogenase